MAKKDKNIYAPNERGSLEQKPKKIKSYSKNGYVELPDPVQDPIISNNISTWEFDYTSKDLLKDENDENK